MSHPETLYLAVANGWEITFPWETDRYAHVIRWSPSVPQSQDSQAWIAKSVERSDNPDWPQSPPLQQLSIETNQPTGPVALGVGMAGRVHWSASFQIRSQCQSFVAELAARVTEPPMHLGSCLQWQHETSLEIEPQNDDNTPGRAQTYVLTSAGQRFRLSVEAESLCSVEQDKICITPRSVTPAKYPATICWGYKLTPIE